MQVHPAPGAVNSALALPAAPSEGVHRPRRWVAIGAATAIYAIALTLDASQLAGQPNGPFQLLTMTASLILQLVVMVGASALAAIATRRGWRAKGQLANT